MRARFPVILQHVVHQRVHNLLSAEQRAGQLILNLQLSGQVAARFVHAGPPNLAVLTNGGREGDVLFVLSLTPFRPVAGAYQRVVLQRTAVQRGVGSDAVSFLDVICTGWLD